MQSEKKEKFFINNAEVAHLVEHDLAKVGVAGSSPVFRSAKKSRLVRDFFSKVCAVLFLQRICLPGGGRTPKVIGATW